MVSDGRALSSGQLKRRRFGFRLEGRSVHSVAHLRRAGELAWLPGSPVMIPAAELDTYLERKMIARREKAKNRRDQRRAGAPKNRPGAWPTECGRRARWLDRRVIDSAIRRPFVAHQDVATIQIEDTERSQGRCSNAARA